MHDRFDVLNDPARWTPGMRPPFLDVQWWQKRIDRIVGKNREGKSIIQLTWAPDADGGIVVNERVKRYWTRRIKDGESWLYVSPPRWVLERRLEPESYWAAHEATRYQFDEDTGEMTDLGPPPKDFYVFDDGSLIADHDPFTGPHGEPKCCDEAWDGDVTFEIGNDYGLTEHRVNQHRRCWGYYRDPNNSDLERIADTVKTRDANRYFDPYQPLSKEQLALIEFEATVQTQRIEQEKQKRQTEMSQDINKTLGWRVFETDPTRLRHGRHHFLNYNTVTGERLKQAGWQRRGSLYTQN